jgi:hypothetical protein
MARDLLPCRSISIVQLTSHILAGFRQEGQNGLVTFLAFVFWVVASAPTHLMGDNRNAPWGILIVADEKERLTPNTRNTGDAA